VAIRGRTLRQMYIAAAILRQWAMIEAGTIVLEVTD
jgi:hypothetical protein